jgi:hypothetical protein
MLIMIVDDRYLIICSWLCRLQLPPASSAWRIHIKEEEEEEEEEEERTKDKPIVGLD